MKIHQKIAVIGSNGSGKSTCCDVLTQYGFIVYSLSDVIREHVKKKQLPQDRATLTQQSNMLKEKFGTTYFAKICLDNAKKSGDACIVFDSIRHPDEVVCLKEHGVFLVGIITNQVTRYNRIKKRQHATDFVDMDTFIQQDEQERRGNSFGQHIEKCLTMCDVIITNDGPLNDFVSEIKSKCGLV